MVNLSMGQDNKVVTVVDSSQARNYIDTLRSSDDPENILTSVSELIKSSGDKIGIISEVDMDFFKASSLNEFNNGALMAEAMPDEYRPFAINFLRQLVHDYNCQTAGEKATAEVVAISFVHILDLKKQMSESFATHNALFYVHNPHSKDPFYGELAGRCTACEKSKMELENRKLLSKELDRAHRQYFTAIQTLRMMKQAPLQVNINANIGQNQVIQTKNG